MSTRWLDADEKIAWIRFAAVLELAPGMLDSQLVRDDGLTHFDYFALAMLSEAEGRTLQLSVLAARTSATLPRLSRVMSRLEAQELVERRPSPDDRRATNVTLTQTGWDRLVHAAPGHVATVRRLFDALTADQVEQLSTISARLLAVLDPDGRMFAHALPR